VLFNDDVNIETIYVSSVIGWVMNMEQLVEWKLAGETEVLGKHLPHWYFVYHKLHMIWYEIEPRSTWWKLRLTAWTKVRPRYRKVKENGVMGPTNYTASHSRSHRRESKKSSVEERPRQLPAFIWTVWEVRSKARLWRGREDTDCDLTRYDRLTSG
jgi:hypothetical protein